MGISNYRAAYLAWSCCGFQGAWLSSGSHLLPGLCRLHSDDCNTEVHPFCVIFCSALFIRQKCRASFFFFPNKTEFKKTPQNQEPLVRFESRNILSKVPAAYVWVEMVRSLREQRCKINSSQVKQNSVLLGFIFLHVGCTSEPLRVTPTQLYMENALFIDQMY